jgi:kynureninase
MLKSHFPTFCAALGDELHVTAHSHHPWPDITRAAHLQYWEDSARLTNRKWAAKVFGEAVPEAQRHVARHLGLPDPKLVAFAPNTHEFVARLYSCLDWSRRPRVLTTASEFHSFGRQTRRLEETGRLEVTRVPVEPYATFRERFRAALSMQHDLVFVSHVFFDSGFVVDRPDELLAGIPADTIVAIDGYHAFMAIPIELGGLADRVFYMAGGYKYAQAGEGACFMSIPRDCVLRPVLTGWFSDFGRLSGAQGEAVGYGEDAMRFWGSTFDASGIYRFNAVMRWLRDLGVGAREIHAHVARLKGEFLARLDLARLPRAALTPPEGEPRANFLTFDLDDAEDVERRLAAHSVVVDRRGRRLRFGFGVYHDDAFVEALLARLGEALA